MSPTRARIDPLEPRTLFATVPAGFVAESVAAGLISPTAMEFAPDGRIFICQQTGALRVVKNGALLATPFVSLTVDSTGERGLLGIAFDPNFGTNRFVYVYHTVPGTTAHNQVTRYTADPANPDVALAGSAVNILDLDNLSSATNHNGGAIHFGPDGKLYVAVGENANGANAQTLANRLGKMLRINSDGSIPTDNPFFNTATGANRAIWALGLRNPYTFAFQPGTGKMHINDVGQNTWEEINVGQAGANYGWSLIEGKRTTQTAPAGYVDPLFVYAHPTTGSDPNLTGIAITGGAFYARPATAAAPFPDAFNADYFYADFGSGTTAGNWIRVIDAGTANSTLFLTGASNIVDLRVGPTDGSLYYLEHTGALQRVRNTIAPPAGLDLTAATDTGVSNSDNLTKTSSPAFAGTTTPSGTVHLFVDGVENATATASAAGQFQVTATLVPPGVHAISASVVTSAGGVSGTSAPLVVTVDQIAPTVTPTFQFATAQRIHLQFSEDVLATLAAGDLALSPQSALTLTTSGPAGTPTTADFAPTATLPDGNYKATLTASSVTDAAGNPLAANLTFGFFVMAADINRDAKVDFNDLVPLAQNYNTFGGKTFLEGDFNYDGNVDFSDLVLLAQRYNTALAAEPVPASPEVMPALLTTAVARPAPAKSKRPNETLFSDAPVVKPVAKPKPAARAVRR